VQKRLLRLRFRFRRRLHKGQKQAADISTQAEQQLEQNLVKRFERLMPVRRFVFGWIGLVLLLTVAVLVQTLNLSNYYQSLKTVPGGIYNEGILGRFTNANPMYATSDADATVSRLLFSGLFKADEKGALTGDLAKDYSVDDHGMVYTVHLKPGLKWQDGKPLTSADVVYTYKAIQNPDTRSPLKSAWEGIDVSAPDAQTVVFKLPSALAAFPYGLTTGIVPQHILGKIPAADMRSANFNTVDPVGAGPFKWQALQVEGDGNPKHTQVQIAMLPFEHYNGGQPKLEKFVEQIFADKDQLAEAFKSKQLTAIVGVSDLPSSLQKGAGVVVHNFPLRAAEMVFFKTTSGVLTEKPVRQALVEATDTKQIIDDLGYPTRAVREPILTGQLGYNAGLAQYGFNLAEAQYTLQANGWVPGSDGIRVKNNQKLAFGLTAANTEDNRKVTKLLQQQWRQAGAKVDVRLLDPTDFQTALNSHDYDSILNGISIGVDPDVFVYWDSSQADIRSANRLNLSEYNNATADAALEAGRTRLDPLLRTIKYRPFLEVWREDAPAVGLYQPRLLYLTNGTVGGLHDHALTIATNRFANVQNWQIRQAKVDD
jgi:peptide/nickel transport system substrate-binding protein